MKHYLITGGVGFLGTNLCLELLSRGHRVTAMDNLYTGMQSNLDILTQKENFHFVKHDIIEPLKLEQFADIDGIYNLACPASPPHYQKDPLYTTKVSTYGLFNLIELAKKNKITIFHTSTSEVYGDPEQHPQTESYRGNVNTIGIRACYDEGKRVAESILFDHQRMHELPIKIVRIFNTYGPHMDPKDGRVVSNFIMQILRNEDITIYGDGSQTRSFCFASDLINGFLTFMNTDKKISGPVNLGNPHELTVNELAQLVLKLIPNSTSKIIFKEIPQDDPTRRKPDISLMQNMTDWSPQVDIEQGLLKTIEYFRTFVEQK